MSVFKIAILDEDGVLGCFEDCPKAFFTFSKCDFRIFLFGNIGKNKVTPNDKAVEDYVYNFEVLFDVVDYFVVNVSSPNTPNLRELQDKEPLTNLLSTLQNLNSNKENEKPILLKIAPDLTNEQLDDIVDIVNETKIAGLIATNTTISREGLTASKERIEEIGAGGLSGIPVRKRSTEVVKYLHEKFGGGFVFSHVTMFKILNPSSVKICPTLKIL